MKKKFFLFAFVFLLLIVGFIVSAQSERKAPVNLRDENSNVYSDKEVSLKAQEHVIDFVSKRGITPEDVSFVKEVDFDSLPKEVNIEGVGEHNLAIYEVSHKKEDKDDKIYVITYSVNELKKQGDLIVAQDKRQFLNFGFSGEMSKSSFLKTSVGVETGIEKGYVMTRDGSITGISTNLEVLDASEGYIELVIYVNGERVGFGNLISTGKEGLKRDYDIQSKDVIRFNAGDVISVYLSSGSNSLWKDVITLVEITTSN